MLNKGFCVNNGEIKIDNGILRVIEEIYHRCISIIKILNCFFNPNTVI